MNALALELGDRGVPAVREPTIQVRYKSTVVGVHRPDFVVDGCVIVEVKAVEALAAVHTQQLLTYLHAARLRVGLLINLNVAVLKQGVKRVVL